MKEKKTVLVVDDQPSMRKNISDLLSRENLIVQEAGDAETMLASIQVFQPQLILLDINLPNMNGLAALGELKRLSPNTPVIVFTAYGTSERAIEAMKAGAYDYLEKPFELDEFLILVRRALSYGELISEVEQLRSQVSQQQSAPMGDQLVGTSPKMQEIFKLIGRVAATDATVLLQGESGTGKELIADAILRHSLRSDKPFIKVNCSALPEQLLESEMFGHEKGSFTGAIAQRQGRFELADGGTIFLDEVNSMSPSLQAKLLRVLQQHTFERVGGKETLTVDVRVVAATNSDIEAEMKAGRFREDLFYRLNVIHVKMPPLREHAEDIPVLVEQFLRQFSPKKNVVISPEVMKKLQQYTWPGNVRELQNVIQRAIVLSEGEVITLDHLPLTLRAEGELIPSTVLWQDGVPFKNIIEDVEKQLILKALRETNWNRTHAAQLLQIHRRLLFSKIKQYRLRPED
jgi:two-component system response regulator AtoC